MNISQSKIKTTIFFLLFICSFGFSQKLKQIKSIETINYKAYLHNNTIIKQDSLRPNFHNVISYNKKGQIKEEAWFNKKGEKFKTQLYEYNENGNLIFEKIIESNVIVITNKYDYNAKNQLISISRILPNDKLTVKTFMKYDSLGNKTSERMETYDGSVVVNGNITVFKYNTEGWIIQTTDMNKSGKIFKDIHFTYDSLGNKISEVTFLMGKFDAKYVFEYDSIGNKHTITKFNENGILYTEKMKYDEFKNLIETNNFYPKSKVSNTTKYNFKYDYLGNWTTETLYTNGKVSFITERKIEYYN